MKKIFVTVSGGCAYVMDDTVPDGFHLEIIDFDNIAAGDRFPSTEDNRSTHVLNAPCV